MTPDEAIESLDAWIRLCRQQGQKGRGRKLGFYQQVIRDLLAKIVRPKTMSSDEVKAAVEAETDPDAQIAQPWRAYAKDLGVNTYGKSRDWAEDQILEILLKRSMAEPGAEGGDVEQPDA